MSFSAVRDHALAAGIQKILAVRHDILPGTPATSCVRTADTVPQKGWADESEMSYQVVDGATPVCSPPLHVPFLAKSSPGAVPSRPRAESWKKQRNLFTTFGRNERGSPASRRGKRPAKELIAEFASSSTGQHRSLLPRSQPLLYLALPSVPRPRLPAGMKSSRNFSPPQSCKVSCRNYST